MKQEKPFFSIIIPTHNRPAQLAMCLRSLARLDYPLDRFEVIVADDGSELPLEIADIRNLVKRYPFKTWRKIFT